MFLLPIVLVSIILGYALHLAGKVAQPIAKLLPDAVVGMEGNTILATLMLVLFSFLAGLLARTTAGARLLRRFEESILGNLPHYQLMKSMAEELAKL